ncbi:MAG: sigma-54-dependent transcriptional regulator [Candidatus Aminicenantia bacterium]
MSSKGIIHIIDDEPVIHDVLGNLFTSEGYEVELSFSGKEALKKHYEGNFDLVLLDLMMPDTDGIQILEQLKKIDPNLMIIIITAYASVESAISTMKLGAFDYIQKPFKHEELLLTIERAIQHKKLKEENIRLREELKEKFKFENIIGKSHAMMKVFQLIKSIAPTRSTILLQGESGTGKELAAKAIHQNSPRVNFPFVVVNSGSLPSDLLESNLFGHVKGAFTGAISHKKGLFEVADKGTIFFDEISTLNPETQAKLLRVIQEKEFMRLGGTKTIKVDVRIIAATNTDLKELVDRREFREDLYYRLNVIKIELPSLKERKDDIPLLIQHFIEMYNQENNKKIKGVSEEVLDILMNYDWPGNIRELENVIERAVVLCDSDIITKHFLPNNLLENNSNEDKFLLSINNNTSLKELTKEYQKRIIIKALREAKGVQKEAAEILNIKPTTLNEMIKRLKIDVKNF